MRAVKKQLVQKQQNKMEKLPEYESLNTYLITYGYLWLFPTIRAHQTIY